MSGYIRPFAPAQAVFFTVCLAQRRSRLLLDHIDVLRRAVAETRADHPFEIGAWVVLPDHMHAVWHLPAGDRRYGVRWGAIKSKFSRGVLRLHGWPKQAVVVDPDSGALKRTLRKSQRDRRELGIWQRRFWEHHCRDAQDLRTHVQYCWSDPVRHRFVAKAADWPASSIHREVRAGRVAPTWETGAFTGAFGEAEPRSELA